MKADRNGTWTEQVRANKVMNEAAGVLEEVALSIFSCETVDGKWPRGSSEARNYHDKCTKLAVELRELCRKAVAQ